jgi:hypothetical protein
MELAKHGERDPQSIINSWNAIASRNDRVSGGKYMAVKNLLDLPMDVQQYVLGQISEMGFESFLLESNTACTLFGGFT